jgi:uncharacterized protein YqeY
MNLKDTITADIKTAMLAGDKTLVTTLRGLKSAILDVEVAKGLRDTGLEDAAIIELLSKEAKKRQESADMFRQGGNTEKAVEEEQEKQVIERYLPKQMSDEELSGVLDDVISKLGGISQQTMGQAIAAMKQKTAGSADGARIALLVKGRIAS